MKTIKKISLVLFATLALSLSSCSSDDDGGGGGSAGAGTITAKVNGTTVTSLAITTYAEIQGNILIVQGNTGGTSSKVLGFNIGSYNGVGTYDIGGGQTGLGQATASYMELVVDPSNPAAFQSSTWQAPFEGGAKVGEIKVSEVTDTNIKGTFFFSAQKNTGEPTQVEVTQGSFNIPLD